MQVFGVYEDFPGYHSQIIPKLKEDSLQKTWEHIPQMHPFSLADGATLLVIEPGVLNDGNGPDFLNAKLLIDSELMVGDVECHLKGNDWYTHGHDKDSNYGNTVLHVVMSDGLGPDLPTLILAPQQIPCLAMRQLDDKALNDFAKKRIAHKEKVLRSKVLLESRLSPYDFGLVETIVNGPYKEDILSLFAFKEGWKEWPGLDAWQGSLKSYKNKHKTYNYAHEIFIQLLENPIEPHSWKRTEHYLVHLGISKVLIKEYYINVWVPLLHENMTKKINLWTSLSVPRHYGFEKKLKRWGVSSVVNNVLTQQGLLYFYQHYCKKSKCMSCPLTGIYQI